LSDVSDAAPNLAGRRSAALAAPLRWRPRPPSAGLAKGQARTTATGSRAARRPIPGRHRAAAALTWKGSAAAEGLLLLRRSFGLRRVASQRGLAGGRGASRRLPSLCRVFDHSGMLRGQRPLLRRLWRPHSLKVKQAAAFAGYATRTPAAGPPRRLLAWAATGCKYLLMALGASGGRARSNPGQRGRRGSTDRAQTESRAGHRGSTDTVCRAGPGRGAVAASAT
jgi:hypothetical protein